MVVIGLLRGAINHTALVELHGLVEMVTHILLFIGGSLSPLTGSSMSMGGGSVSVGVEVSFMAAHVLLLEGIQNL